jgi:hypothetical protein
MQTHGDHAGQATALCRTGLAACGKEVLLKRTSQKNGLLQITGIEVAGPLEVRFVPIIFHARIFSSVFPCTPLLSDAMNNHA